MAMADAKKIKVTLIKSLIGTKAPHRDVRQGPGLAPSPP